MEYLFTMLFGKSTAIGTAAIIIFSSPAIRHEGSKIVVRGKLDGIVNPRVEHVLSKGGRVNVIFDVSMTVYEKKGPRIVQKKFIHSLQYDRKKRIYLADCQGRKTAHDSIKKLAGTAGEYHVVLAYGTSRAEYYDFYIEADIECDSTYIGALRCDPLWYTYRPAKSIKKIRAYYIR